MAEKAVAVVAQVEFKIREEDGWTLADERGGFVLPDFIFWTMDAEARYAQTVRF